MGSVSRLSEKCRKCPFVSKCDKKKMEALAYIEPIAQPISQSLTEPLAAPVMAEHDYRDVKIGPNTTITIDLKDIKKQLEVRFNPLGLQYGG